jgi:Copper chaperone
VQYDFQTELLYKFKIKIMNTLKFKTTIKCGGCIATVTPFLNKIEGISKWSVDTNSPDKILTIETESASPEEITNMLKTAGYQANLI